MNAVISFASNGVKIKLVSEKESQFFISLVSKKRVTLRSWFPNSCEKVKFFSTRLKGMESIGKLVGETLIVPGTGFTVTFAKRVCS